jgi:transcriptional repressor NrdR
VICPFCGQDNDKVMDSRAADGGLVIRRRRECLECARRYTTYERVERTARLMVVKKDGSRVAFDPQNVLRGLQAACGKRPVPEDVKERIAREVEDEGGASPAASATWTRWPTSGSPSSATTSRRSTTLPTR